MLTDSINYKRSLIKCICYLKPLEVENKIIQLNAGINTIGRCLDTGIKDIRCSKTQLELRVNLETRKIRMKVLGLNPCGVNGFMALHNVECQITHGDVLEIIYGRYKHEVVLSPPDNEIETSQCGQWESIEKDGVLVFTSDGVHASDKIAGYDVDGTIIRTKSGNVFPKNCDDWQLNFPEVRQKLKCLYDDGYKIVFFSNQGGIEKGKVNVNAFKVKVNNIVKQIGVPVQAFFAISGGFCRKPAPGMWYHMQKYNSKVIIKLQKSFYVGDAAGRPEFGSGANKRKKDYSLADRLFAANVGVSFYTPEEHFLEANKQPYNKPAFEPRYIDTAMTPLFNPPTAEIKNNGTEVVVLVGLPGSGKSHFAQHYLVPLGYRVFNADTLGSTQACIRGCQKALNSGESCVVDNTNVDIETRKKIIDIARSFRVPCRCFVMNVALPQLRHNIAFRQLVDVEHSKISDMVINMLRKKYREPTLDEGFNEVIQVNQKIQFDDAEQAELYKLYLVEK